MIHRQNWLDINAYLRHMEQRVGRHTGSIHKYRTQLRHLLEWADATPLPQARGIDPVFPSYLITARADGKPQPLTYTTIYKTLVTVRAYFQFARLEWPQRYRRVSESWIALLRPARQSTPAPTLRDHQFYTLEEVRRLVSVSTETLRLERARAGAALLFLGGMRPDTLASLPIANVELPLWRILQLPQSGVRTKNNKAAITYLLDIPDLRSIVTAWDQRVRKTLSARSLWYAKLNHDGMQLLDTQRAIEGRVSLIGDDLRLLCAKAGVDYKSPHKMRHGHIVYARSLARDMDELKAISQNVMHSNSIITDQVYSSLTNAGVGATIAALGKQTAPAELIAQLTALLNQLKRDL